MFADDEIYTIPLRRRDGSVRAVTLVDREDVERFGDRRWHVLSSRAGKRYAGRFQRVGEGGPGEILLHREIMGLSKEDPREVDHVNGDGLDNRKENLRVCTPAENAQNVPARGGYSRHRGVTHMGPRYTRKPWKAQVRHEGRLHGLGYFATEQEAADAAAAFRREHMPFATD